jgi:hypothetical protein
MIHDVERKIERLGVPNLAPNSVGIHPGICGLRQSGLQAVEDAIAIALLDQEELPAGSELLLPGVA